MTVASLPQPDEQTFVEPGRFTALSRATFLTKCFKCRVTIELNWRRSGSSLASVLLRAAGWRPLGQTNGARWHCPACAGGMG